MHKVFITSDHHFSHENFLSFMDSKGEIIRKFSCLDEMDQVMIDNWNRVVRKDDKVYHLGDLCFSKNALDRIMPQLNGTKVLIKGNHDKLKLSDYMKYFKDVRSSHRLDGMLLTHIPIHPYMFERIKCNIHGHTHINSVMIADGIIDNRYFNACVEVNNYTPIEFEKIRDEYDNA